MRVASTVLACLAFALGVSGAGLIFIQARAARAKALEVFELKGAWDMSDRRVLQMADAPAGALAGFQAEDDIRAIKAFLHDFLAGTVGANVLGAWLAATGAMLGLASTLVAIWAR
ncbi:MAG TPA: hypothetical protein VFP54_11000 [Acidimicrobiales bacterium]|nr:hypothetical protein [Acidimicrobiales bacterium]